jgi:putative heme-binding domain-containing protein
LAKLVEHKNDWYVRHSRRILQERVAERAAKVAGKRLPRGPNGDHALPEFVAKSAEESLVKTFTTHVDASRRLRALWALHACRSGVWIRDIDLAAYADQSPSIRAWASQLSNEDADQYHKTEGGLVISRERTKEVLSQPVERLYAASTAQRLRSLAITDGLARLFAHGEDAGDHNLPLMYWYALEPLVDERPAQALDLALNGKIPLLVTFTVRKIASDQKPESIELLIDALQFAKRDEQALAILSGLLEALKGRRDVAAPENWAAAYDKLKKSRSTEILLRADALAAAFGDEAVLAVFRQTLQDPGASVAAREQALTALLRQRDKKLPPILRQLLRDESIRAGALRGLAVFDDPETPGAILTVYSQLLAAEKRDAIATLAARKSYANELLIAVAEKKIPPADITADLARQVKNLGDEQITTKLTEVWGSVSDTSVDAKAEIARWTRILTNKPKREPEPAHGRAVFAKTCQQCHTLFGEGGKVGPDLTGSNRANLEYVLSNILDPSAVMAKEYQPSVVTLADGRVITGIIKQQDKNTVTIQTPNETLTVGRDEIEEMTSTPISMMPSDLLKQHTEAEVRALISYLASPRQAPLAEAAQDSGGH